MPKKLAEVVDEIYARFESAGARFAVKEVEEEVRAAYDAGQVIEDPVDARIASAVKSRDKAGHQEADGQLVFSQFAFPRILVIADGERQPTRSARLEHVLADEIVKRENKLRQDQAFLRLQQRNQALLPYLQAGMTVTEAIEAWQRENKGSS